MKTRYFDKDRKLDEISGYSLCNLMKTRYFDKSRKLDKM